MTISAELGQLEAFVRDLVAKGRYASASEVLCEGVRLLQARERREAELEAALARGLEDVSEGRVVAADKVFDRLEAKYEAIAARGAMKVLLSAGAERQLEQIGDTIAAENAQRALSFVRELRKRCDGLAQFPLRFPLVRWHRNIGIRRCIHGNYLISYTVTEAEIIVLHILHGARDYEAIVFPTD